MTADERLQASEEIAAFTTKADMNRLKNICNNSVILLKKGLFNIDKEYRESVILECNTYLELIASEEGKRGWLKAKEAE